MNLSKLQSIDKLVFSKDDISRKLNISVKSAQVTASRYVKRNLLIRLKRDYYSFPFQLNNAEEEELFEIANLLQTPSYISLNSALSYYSITTQQTRRFIESIVQKRTEIRNAAQIVFTFTQVRESLYFGFKRENNFFIATPEKALADAVYLTAMGKYSLDFDAVDFSKINLNAVGQILDLTNKMARNLWRNKIKI